MDAAKKTRTAARARYIICGAAAILLATIAIYLWCVAQVKSEASYAKIPKNTANWMGDISDDIAHKTLRELILPGTHNAGSRNWDGWGAAHLIETQTLTIAAQLEYGIRYFDFRAAFSKKNKSWIFSHAGWSMRDKIFPALDDIKSFLDSHPKEILILDFQHFPEIKDADDINNLPALRDKIMQTLASYMLPATRGVHTKLQELWTNNKRVIILITDGIYDTFSTTEKNLLWKRSASIESPWANKTKGADVVRYLDEKIISMKSGYTSKEPKYYDKFFVVQAVSTASKSLGSLQTGALKTNPVILSILEGNKLALSSLDWRTAPLNIVLMDYVETIDITPIIKNMNLASSSDTCHNGVYLYERKNYGGYYTRLLEDSPSLSKRFIVDTDGYENHVAFDNQVSSIKIIGNYKIELFEHPDFKGASQMHTASIDNLGDFDNRGMSARVYKLADEDKKVD